MNRQVAEAAPSTSAEPRGTNPLPSNFLQPDSLSEAKASDFDNFRGHCRLGRSHFFGDGCLSATLPPQLSWAFGTSSTPQSTTARIIMMQNGRAGRPTARSIGSFSIQRISVNIGNAYYRMNILGGSIQFDPVVLPLRSSPTPSAVLPPSPSTATPFGWSSNHTPRREGKPSSRRVLFNRKGVLALPAPLRRRGSDQLEGIQSRPPLNPQTHEIDESKRQELRHGNRLQYQGQTYQVRIAEDGSIDLLRVSYFANYIPPPSQNQTLQAFDWQAAGSPTIQDGGWKMKPARASS